MPEEHAMAVAPAPTIDTAYTQALEFLTRVPLIDGHNDLPFVIRKSREARGDLAIYDLTKVHPETDTDIPRLQAGKVAAQFWAAFVFPNDPKPAGFALAQIALVRAMNARHADVFLPALAACDVAAAHRQGKIASFITIENGSALDGQLDALDAYYGLGVRLMTLCHNGTHDWCDSATDAPRHNGLSPFGRDVIARMNDLGMIVDLAHVSHKVMHDVLDISRTPVVWSHSNVFSLCDHPRNVPDDVLARVKANRGIVMATFVPDFLSQASRDWHRPAKDAWGKTPDGLDYVKAEADIAKKAGPRPKATLAQYCDHVEHLARVIGHDHIGIGSDFFGGATVEGLEDVSTFPAVFAELIRRGWSEDNLARLASGNFLRVFAEIERARRA
jgi:membrane dipeptidase